MKESAMTAGGIYEAVCKLRSEVTELDEALDAIYNELGDQHIAYKLLDDQKTVKFNELRQFEAQVFVVKPGVSLR